LHLCTFGDDLSFNATTICLQRNLLLVESADFFIVP